ncbi:hypothetical protein J2858_002563 [Neorhizobium galegae]|uniref:hypothetical protein n=1 Tax=Neorhizobium galegae TaxID=399 RepID=UPI001AE2E832|nr:hypothetical protein [Neorhizobium galegae]MBP2549640.1 hypothetical protein [Neorhizobium galegae]
MTRILLAFCFSATVAAPVSAEEPLIIWVPSKTSDTSYAARMGLRIPGWTAASAGLETGVASAVAGGPVDMPVRLWGQVRAEQLTTPALQLNRTLDFTLNALTGSAAAQMSRSEKEILTPDLDLQVSRTYALRYDGGTESWSGLDVNQALKLSYGDTGSAIQVKAGAIDSFKRVGGGVVLEQKIGNRLKITGEMNRAAGGDPAGRVNARYFFRW